MSMLAGSIDAADAGSIGAEAAVGADVAASRPVGVTGATHVHLQQFKDVCATMAYNFALTSRIFELKNACNTFLTMDTYHICDIVTYHMLSFATHS